ncbi:hypothetical protein ACGF8B_36990 [Streptomyces sp. NPDC047917]|uniref:hypothetical protein n=1 Tax=Streptomyces sp. NPDC047917 TaxID=3365491 RepID=UPI00371C789B
MRTPPSLSSSTDNQAEPGPAPLTRHPYWSTLSEDVVAARMALKHAPDPAEA